MLDAHAHTEGWSRREFVSGVTLAGTAGFFGLQPEAAAGEPPPETRTIKLIKISGICICSSMWPRKS